MVPAMSRFTSKIVICVLPVLLSAIIIAFAIKQTEEGQGGFKLGVDLAGGTDLIYEVDPDKFADERARSNYNPQDMAHFLKRRIDPADLYNVTIRPVGNTRVEIILPTGGLHQAKADEAAWQRLLEKVEEKWPLKTYNVAKDRRIELLARVNAQHPDVPVADIEKFIDQNYQAKTGTDATWKDLLAKVAKQYPPKSYDAGRGRLPTLVNQIREQYPDVSPADIGDFVEKNYNVGKERRQLTTEEVQRIKELISQQGSLEFRILANGQDDREAFDAAKKYFADVQKESKLAEDLKARAIMGNPPPPPVATNGDKFFEVSLKNGKFKFSYSWVELGRSERQQLGLSNAAGVNAAAGSFWKTVEAARQKGETVPVPGSDSLLWSRTVLNPRLPESEAGKKVEYFMLTRDPLAGREITGTYLTNAFQTTGQSLQPEVGFRFNDEGGRRFHEVTSNNAPDGSGENSFKRHLAVVLDGRIESAPAINQAISNEGVIQGRFTKDEVDRYVNMLRAGALPASLKPQPASESTIGPTLGRETISAGTWSVVIAFVAILAFMLVYYRFAGLVACIALLANLLLTVAFMVVVNATFTLPGLAGLVLMLGMAVDANVLIYERLREERDRGASLALAIRNGYDRAFPTIIDTHLSSIFTAIVLYTVGNDQLKGFGISLTVGLLISLFTSLYMTRLMFDIWQFKGWLHKLSMFRLFSRPNIDFMRIRYYWFTATIILTVVGAAVFIHRLDSGGLNIDFTKGTAYGGLLVKGGAKDDGMVTIQELRDMFKDCKLPDLSFEQIFYTNAPELSEGDRSRRFTVRTPEQNPKVVQDEISRALDNKLKKTELKTFDIDPSNRRVILSFVDPSTGQPAAASRSQLSMILNNEFENVGRTTAGEEFVLEGLGKEEDGRFKWMDMELMQPVPRAKLESVLKATQGEFARRPQPERLENFDSQLAKETQARALYAILASWGATLFYLWFRFGNWTFGLATVLCLIHDLFFTLGIIGFSHYMFEWWPGLAGMLGVQDFKIDLPTIAALLTLVGYSVNDTIVVFDRIREVRGKNPLLTPQMINDSVNQTLSRTLLTSFATWLVVFVLYVAGGAGVHLFAFVMVVGVIVGTYSSIYIASPLLLIFGEGAPRKAVRPQPAESQTANV
jgi:SecD/SecF fusion protein